VPRTTSQYRSVAGASGTAANFLLLAKLLGLTPPQLAEVTLILTLALTLARTLTLALALTLNLRPGLRAGHPDPHPNHPSPSPSPSPKPEPRPQPLAPSPLAPALTSCVPRCSLGCYPRTTTPGWRSCSVRVRVRVRVRVIAWLEIMLGAHGGYP